MTVAHEGRAGAIISTAVAALAASARFQSLTGAADAAAAVAYVVEADGGPMDVGPLNADGVAIDLLSVACYAEVLDSLLPQTRAALATVTVAARVPVLIWLRPSLAHLSAQDLAIPAQRLRWVRGNASAIAAEIQTAARGTFGPSAICDLLQLSIPEPESDPFPEWYRAVLALDWRSPT